METNSERGKIMIARKKGRREKCKKIYVIYKERKLLFEIFA